MENEIKAALIRLLKGIKDSDTQETLDGMDALEALSAEYRGKMHPQLAHFLERRSYAKALDFLGGEGVVTRGRCAPR
ncbi:MAG: hypothetical protein R3F07_05990 [Opitutaceae bacterium]